MLSVRNVGNGAARNLKVTLDQNFSLNGEPSEASNLRNFEVFKERIESFAARAEIDIPLGAGSTVFKNPDLCPTKFTAEVRYTFEQHKIVERTRIDLTPFRKHAFMQDAQIVELKRLNVAVESMAKALGEYKPPSPPQGPDASTM